MRTLVQVTRPLPGVGTQNAALLAEEPAAGAEIFTPPEQDDNDAPEDLEPEPVKKKARHKAIGSNKTIHVNSVSVITGSASRKRISRFELARGKGLQMRGNNAQHQAAVRSSYVLASFEDEDNAEAGSSGRGAGTTDSHVQKVRVLYYSFPLTLPSTTP
jgi:hypothetical protein